MLLELHISGLGVIDDVSLEFAPGLNVLTGETGAGKTMVTVGLALVLGRRAQSTLVRAGADRARVEGRFDVRGIDAAREWAENEELVLGRSIGADGRSTARAGGQLAPASTLAELGEGLVEIHGQYQTQRLLTPAAQLAFIDRFAGEAHLGVLTEYRDAYARLRDLGARRDAVASSTRERERERDLLTHQVREIEAADLGPGEEESLRQEEALLGNAERVLEYLGTAKAALGGEDAGADALGAAAAALHEAATADPGARPLAERVASLAAEARDASEAVRSHLDSLDLDPARLEAVRQRVATIRGLERKYGETIPDVLAYLSETKERLASLEHVDDELADLEAAIEATTAAAGARAEAISATREERAPRLGEAVEAELEELGMDGVTFTVELSPQPRLGPDGMETAEFRFSGGPGQESLPLSRVASGGELSRTMLACRTVLADLDEIPTIVFDEVDAGIGGHAAVAVGKRLARLARRRQVLVVTHLPQIACFADRQFRVTKSDGRADVSPLEEADRVEELSRMLSGEKTPEAAVHAERLLEQAANEKAMS
jgi:DNA repair protein RecN (Recombination protein N)